jgi:hypothetical protein
VCRQGTQGAAQLSCHLCLVGWERAAQAASHPAAPCRRGPAAAHLP